MFEVRDPSGRGGDGLFRRAQVQEQRVRFDGVSVSGISQERHGPAGRDDQRRARGAARVHRAQGQGVLHGAGFGG